MDIRTQSYLLSAIVGTAIGIAMLLRSRRPRVVTQFGIFAITLSAYYFATFCEQFVPWEGGSILGRIVLGATIVSGSIVPMTALSFFLEFVGASPRFARTARRISWISAFLGLTVALSPLARLLWARVLIGTWVLLALSFSVGLLLARMRGSASRVDRLRLLYLAVGTGASLLFSGLDMVGRFGFPVPTLGCLVATLNLYFLSQTLLRLRLMDLHELLGKIASQTVLAFIFSLAFVLLTMWVAENPTLYIFNTGVAALVILILFEPLATWVHNTVTAIAFRQRFAFLEQGRALLRRGVNVIDVPDFASLVLDGLNETRRVTHASVYLLADDRPGFRLLDSRGPSPVPFLDPGASRALALRTERAQLLETVERRIAALKTQPSEARRSRDELRRLNDVTIAMEAMKAGLTVPLMGTERVLGFLNLRDERVPESFASDEIALILDIAEQFARVVENSKLYEKMRERDRLAALGEMAAGLAHEIRNPLGGIKGAAQCLDPKQMSTDEREFVSIISEEVQRLNGVVSAFLDYARPLKQSFGPTDLNEVVSRTLKLIENDVPQNVAVTSSLAEGLPLIVGDSEELKQVLLNLIQNAMQAIAEKPGTITVRTARAERFLSLRTPDAVEVLVSDDGPGIPAEHHLNLFVPFFTTKLKGTGLGLAICQRIVKNHGGSIAIQSRVGEGSTFVVRLPTLAHDTQPDFQSITSTNPRIDVAQLSLPRQPNQRTG